MTSNLDHVNEFNMNQLATASAFVDSDANFIAATSFGVPTDHTPFSNITTTTRNTTTTTTTNTKLESPGDIQISYITGDDSELNNGIHTSEGGKSAKKRRTSTSPSASKIQQLPMFLTSTSFDISIHTMYQLYFLSKSPFIFISSHLTICMSSPF